MDSPNGDSLAGRCRALCNRPRCRCEDPGRRRPPGVHPRLPEKVHPELGYKIAFTSSSILPSVEEIAQAIAARPYKVCPYGRIGRFAQNRYLCRASEGDAGLCGPVSWYSRNLQASGGCFFIFTLIASVIGLRVE